MLDDLAELRLQRESLAFMAARVPSVSEGAAASANAPNARGTMRVVELGKQLEHTLASASKTLEESGRRVLKEPPPEYSSFEWATLQVFIAFSAVGLT